MSRRYQFGPFLLDARERRLTRDGEAVQIEPKSFDVLHLLLTNAGRLVDKRTLVDTVWSGAVVTDNSLTRCIHQIRAALDDNADSPAFIETVPGTGYRFVGPVDRIEQQGPMPDTRLPSRHLPVRPWHVALLALIAIAAALWVVTRSTPVDAPPIRRLAVLPFENLTGDPGQEYFVEGVHEALIAELSRVASIDVISRTSVMQFRDSSLPVPVVAQRLGVDAIVEGSVLRAGDNLTVTAQLIAAMPERHIWANRYHRRVSELFEITTEITRAIADEIAVELTPEEQLLLGRSRPVDTGAYDDYLLARFHFARRTPDGYRKAQELFRQALDKDPNLAPAYAGLAHSFGSAAIFGVIEPAAGMPKARDLAEHALQIDGNLVEGHLILAGVMFYWDWDSAEAERRINHALSLNPNSANAYRTLSEVYSVMDRHEEALAAIERARELDPLVATSQFKPALILYLARDYDAAIGRASAALQYYPEYWPGHWLHCLALSAQGSQEEAARACKSAVKYSHREPMALGTLGYVNALEGHNEAALEIAGELETMMSRRYVSRASIAIIYAALGDRDRALDFLEEAFRYRDQLLVHARNATFLDSLRSDKRFIQLLRNPPPPRPGSVTRTRSNR